MTQSTHHTKPTSSSQQPNHATTAAKMEASENNAPSWKKWQSRIEQLEDLMATQSVQLIQCRMELEHFQKQQKETNNNKQENTNNSNEELQKQQQQQQLEETIKTILWKQQYPKMQNHLETKLKHSMEKDILIQLEKHHKLRSYQESVVIGQLQTELRNLQATLVPQQKEWSNQLVELWNIVQQQHQFTQSLQEQLQSVSQRMQQQHTQQQHQKDEWDRTFRELSKAVRQHAADQLEQGTKFQTFMEEYQQQKRQFETERQQTKQQQQQFRQMLETLQNDIGTWKQTMEQSIQKESERMLHFQTGLLSTTDQSIQNVQAKIDHVTNMVAQRQQEEEPKSPTLDWESLRQKMESMQMSKVDREDWKVLQSKVDVVMEQIQALQKRPHPSWTSSEKDEEEEKKEEDQREETTMRDLDASSSSSSLVVPRLWQELQEQMRQLQSWVERMDADQKAKDQLWHNQWEQCRVVEHTLQHQLRESQWENRGLYRTLKKLQQQQQTPEQPPQSAASSKPCTAHGDELIFLTISDDATPTVSSSPTTKSTPAAGTPSAPCK